MTKKMRSSFFHLIKGGATISDFIRINNFDREKLYRWFRRIGFTKTLAEVCKRDI